MILTLKVKLIFGLYADGDWEGIFEINAASTCDELHAAIQRALKFDDDHLYEFYIARTARSGDRVHFDDENGLLYTQTWDDIFPLPKDRNFYYLFDYGDSWLFQVSRTRHAPSVVKPRVRYPRLILSTGKRPEQYPPYEE